MRTPTSREWCNGRKNETQIMVLTGIQQSHEKEGRNGGKFAGSLLQYLPEAAKKK
jgi:hypothetical protein